MKLYLDICCLNRPFDDQSQRRIHLESEAVMLVLAAVQAQEHTMLSSDVLNLENSRNPNDERRIHVQDTLALAARHVELNEETAARARELAAAGFGAYDALHLACAESAGADVLLTTDDALLRKASRRNDLKTRVCNPLAWVGEMDR